MVSNVSKLSIAEVVLDVIGNKIDFLYQSSLVDNLYAYAVIVDPDAKFGKDDFNKAVLYEKPFGENTPFVFRQLARERAKTALYLRDMQTSNMHTLIPPSAIDGCCYMYGIPVGFAGLHDPICESMALDICGLFFA